MIDAMAESLARSIVGIQGMKVRVADHRGRSDLAIATDRYSLVGSYRYTIQDRIVADGNGPRQPANQRARIGQRSVGHPPVGIEDDSASEDYLPAAGQLEIRQLSEDTRATGGLEATAMAQHKPSLPYPRDKGSAVQVFQFSSDHRVLFPTDPRHDADVA